MDEVDADYAPQSPDLTPVHKFPPGDADVVELHPQHQQYRRSLSHIPSPLTPSQDQSFRSYWSGSAWDPPQQRPPFRQDSYTSNVAYFNPDGMPRRTTKKELDGEEDYAPERSTRGSATGNGSTAPAEIEVKTKFPVARIKRIMQADEEVGKVAQVTPVVVSKALELFMISLVTKAASEARARSSKKVTASHLKSAVLKHEQFDFLNEIVSKVAEAVPGSKGGQAHSNEGDSDDQDLAPPTPAAGGRKKRPAPRKRRKDDSD